MTTERQALTLAQWLSPAFPVGAFAYSHGLETAIRDGAIRDAADLRGWLETVLAHGSGRNDAVLLRMAHGCADVSAVTEIDAMARANAAGAERLRETVLQGAAFCQTVRALGVQIPDDLTYPVAVGFAAGQARFDLTLTVALYLQAFVGNLVSAAVRAVPLGQTEGQRVLADLASVCESVAASEDATMDDLHGTAFLSDIAAMRHETLQPRIFRS